jgi:hypothetical protein
MPGIEELHHHLLMAAAAPRYAPAVAPTTIQGPASPRSRPARRPRCSAPGRVAATDHFAHAASCRHSLLPPTGCRHSRLLTARIRSRPASAPQPRRIRKQRKFWIYNFITPTRRWPLFPPRRICVVSPRFGCRVCYACLPAPVRGDGCLSRLDGCQDFDPDNTLAPRGQPGGQCPR